MNKLATTLVVCILLALAGCGTEATAPAPGEAAPREAAAGKRPGGKSAPVAQPAGPRPDESPTMIGSGN